MLDSTTVPMEARCLGCGYQLRGLPQNICPECGRAFDPNDPKTFDTRPPNWRRRLWIRRGVCAAMLAVACAGIGPRGVLKGDLTFTCTKCGAKESARRVQLNPPRWISWRYPGYGWTTQTVASKTSDPSECSHDFPNVSVRFDFSFGGWATATRNNCDESLTFNGMFVNRKSARDVLYHLMSPANNGIGP